MFNSYEKILLKKANKSVGFSGINSSIRIFLVGDSVEEFSFEKVGGKYKLQNRKTVGYFDDIVVCQDSTIYKIQEGQFSLII